MIQANVSPSHRFTTKEQFLARYPHLHELLHSTDDVTFNSVF